MKKLRIGILGCGAISGHYLRSARDVFSDTQVVTACADLIREKAAEAAREYGIAKIQTPEEMLDDPDLDLIVNLTVPRVHEELTLACLAHGKHVYSEKPIAMTREGAAMNTGVRTLISSIRKAPAQCWTWRRITSMR
jgi:predicted dehydrogenase